MVDLVWFGLISWLILSFVLPFVVLFVGQSVSKNLICQRLGRLRTPLLRSGLRTLQQRTWNRTAWLACAVN